MIPCYDPTGGQTSHLSSTLTISPSSPDAPFASREELEARLASEYGAHLAILDQRLDDALRATGFDGAVIFAGDEQIVFRDDQTYPFRVEPYFKAWVPLTQAPGSFLRLVPGQRPMLVYKQVEDYWYEPPSDPEGYWTQHFDIRVARSDAEARKLSGSGARWVAIGSAAKRAARSGEAGDAARSQRPRFLSHLDFTAPSRPPTSCSACAARKHGRARPRRRRRSVQVGRDGARAASGLSRGERAARDRAAVRQHHRPERARRDAALPAHARGAAAGRLARC